MTKISENWVHIKNNVLTLNDKIISLMSIKHKLVLVQQHELERLKVDKHKSKHANYINDLYNHYIVNNGSKTYINNYVR